MPRTPSSRNRFFAINRIYRIEKQYSLSVGNLLCLVSLSCLVSLHLFRHCLLPRRSENTFFSHFPLTKLDENVSTLDAIIFILYGSNGKSPFLLYKKPLFYIQKGAFSIIPLREKNDGIKTGNDKMSLGNNPLQAKYACLL